MPYVFQTICNFQNALLLIWFVVCRSLFLCRSFVVRYSCVNKNRLALESNLIVMLFVKNSCSMRSFKQKLALYFLIMENKVIIPIPEPPSFLCVVMRFSPMKLRIEGSKKLPLSKKTICGKLSLDSSNEILTYFFS